MASWLAYAQAPDAPQADLSFVLQCLLVVAVIVVLAFIPYRVALSRQRWAADRVRVAAVFWGLLAAGSVLYANLAQVRWAREHATLVASGYYDPNQETQDAPRMPWGAWTGLALAYVGLLAWAAWRGRAPATSDCISPQPPDNPPPN